MPDDFSPDAGHMDVQAHIDALCAFFMQLGVSPEQAADCVVDMVLETYEFYGARH